MKDKFSVFLRENGIKVDGHYSIESLLARLGFKPVYDPEGKPNDAQIQVFDCHGDYEMTNSADFRHIILPNGLTTKDRNWIVARLMGSWINAKVDNAGNYNAHLSYLMGIKQLETVDRPRLANVNDIALKVLMPDELLDSVLPGAYDEDDYNVIAKHLNVPVAQLANRLKQYEYKEFTRG